VHNLIYNKKPIFYEKNIHNPKVSLGNVTSDGTLSNVTALMVAREKAFPPCGDFPGFRVAGAMSALRHYGYSRGIILVSTRGHYSITKAANILGIGESNVINIPVDMNNRIDIKKLLLRVKKFNKSKGKDRTKIISIIGIAGTTETGNIDDLEALGEIAHKAGTHFHVDASWGGPALLADEYRPLFKGIERADSVAFDSHKLLYCPASMGLALFKSEKDLGYIKHSSRYIIRKNSVDTGRFTLEGSRPFACLKPWASLKIIGSKGYGLLFRHARNSTDYFKEILDSCGNFETLNNPELFILNYRFIPEQVLNQIIIWKKSRTQSGKKEKKTETRIQKTNRLINSLNIKLHRALRKDDTTFVSRTTLESTVYRPQNIVVLRAVLINPLTEKETLDEIKDTQNRIGLEMWKEFKPAFERIKVIDD